MDFLWPLKYPIFCANVRRMAQEEAKSINFLEMDKTLMKATEDTFWYEFEIGYEEAKHNLKNASFYFVETILTGMDQCPLDDKF